MTRGKIILITDKGLFSSIEFNGDMYPPSPDWRGFGGEVVNGLKDIHTYTEYSNFVRKFNQEHHNYEEDELVFFVTRDLEGMLNMRSGDYFDEWFSDYLYIKSIRTEPTTVIDRDGTQITIQNGNIIVLYFGKFTSKCAAYSTGNNKNGKTLEEQVIEICEANGWAVRVYQDEIEICQYSPLGEDFFFTVDRNNLVQDIIDYCNDFDPDEHAEMWIEGRGTKGIPNSIRALIDDADAIDEMLEELALELSKFNER